MSVADQVKACPFCDTTSVSVNRTRNTRTYQPDKYSCRDCGRTFEDPTERDRKYGTKASTVGLARQLERMDPDEVGG